MSTNDILTKRSEQLIDIFMGMAHHKEVQRNCGEFLHAHHLTAEGSGVLVLGLGNRVVCLQDQVHRTMRDIVGPTMRGEVLKVPREGGWISVR